MVDVSPLIALISLCSGILAGMLLYNFMPVSGAYWKKRLAKTMDKKQEPEEPWWRPLLAPFRPLVKYVPGAQVHRTKTYLFWAQRMGKWEGWTPVDVWALRIAGLTGGLVLGLVLGQGNPLLTLIPAAVGFLYPGVTLEADAKKAIRAVKRELPDLAQMVLLLVEVGHSVPEALKRVATDDEGVIAAWLRDVMAKSAGRALLSEEVGREGILLQKAKETGLRELAAFAAHLEEVHRQGKEEEKLLGRLADKMASDYETEVLARAEALEGKLVVPLMIFFLLPYIVAILLPVLGPAVAFFTR